MRITEYTIENAPFDLRIGLVADLHERNGLNVLKALEWEKPDIVCFAGDTFERRYRMEDYAQIGAMPLFQRMLIHGAFWINDRLYTLRGISKDTSPQETYSLLEGLKVPTFLSLGNHDPALNDEDREALHRAGIRLLDNTHCTVDWMGQQIRIGGLSSKPDTAWLEQYSSLPGYKLLLCHHPEYYPLYLKDKNLDLILSGHVHGGQIRIARQGLFAPGQGFFPQYYHGVYHNKMVVSAGCTDTTALPRWGNPCELVVVQLKKGDKR